MLGTNVLLDALVNLLAADTATLANAAALHLHLAMAPFTPAVNLVVAGMTEATFTGAGAKSAGVGAQGVFVDPVSGLRTILILEPAGGWQWQCTVTPAPAQSIYGVYLTDNADAVLLGSELFAQPIVISAAGQGIAWPYDRLQLVASALR